jgi:hypothetical protein
VVLFWHRSGQKIAADKITGKHYGSGQAGGQIAAAAAKAQKANGKIQ